MQTYLKASSFFDFDDAGIKALSQRLVKPGMNDIEKAVALYYAVRDDITYNPYTFDPAAVGFKASACLQQGQSYCVPKAILLGALCRLNSIPARLGLADVRNHLSSPGLVEFLKSDVFVMHGYIDLFLAGKWVKATPAFDAKLCARMQVAPLAFNGRDDSIFHEHNGEGARHMEYLTEHGTFEDVPLELIVGSVAQAYPHLVERFKGSGSSAL
jgi:transglutaminase-like putative cysteine protease